MGIGSDRKRLDFVQSVLIYDGIVSRTVVRVFYAIIVAVPLLFSTVATLRNYGILIFVSVAVSAVFFADAFVSIWCFFAAILSAYVVYIIHRETPLQLKGSESN